MAYESKQVSAPRLAGAGLRAFARLIEQPMSGRVVRDALLRQMGLDAFRAADVRGAATDTGPLPADARAWPHDPVEDAWKAVVNAPGEVAGERPVTLLDQHRALRDGTTDPVALAKAFLAEKDRSERDPPAMRFYIAQDGMDLMTQARASRERWRAGDPLGPLDGVLVSIKDELDQVPYPTTAGTRIHDTPARTDATAVARLRVRGALLTGKVNMHELGSGLTGINPHWGTPRNPYDTDRICGGSSSGSGAIVSAGLTPLSLACDAGGSIRMPAAFTGVVGLKPTRGRVSQAGTADLVWSTAHTGPIGATAADAALAYLAIAGPDPLDPHTLSQPPVHLTDWAQDDARGITLGVFRDWFEDADASVVEANRAQLRHFEALGAEIREIVLPDLEQLALAHLVLIGVEAAASQLHPYETDHRRYSHESRLSMALARGLRATDYVHAQRVRSKLIGQWLDATAGLDAIVTPATGCVAPPIQADAIDLGDADMALSQRIMRFMPPANLLGFPAITFPVGYDLDGMPIAMQVMGRPWMEHVLLRLARLAGAHVPRKAPRRTCAPALS